MSCLKRWQPSGPTTWKSGSSGRHNLLRGNWRQAADYHARIVELQPIDDPALELAGLRLLSGDAGAYRQLFARLTKEMGERQDGPKFFLSRICSIGGDSGIDPARAIAWAKRAVASDRTAWCVYALGMSLYRGGQYQQAIARLEESSSLRWSKAGYRP
jgi:tetratricopeptide (TPR) repeat protein